MIDMEALRQQGWCSAQVLDEAAVTQLSSMFNQLEFDHDQEFFASSNDLDAEESADLQERLRPVLEQLERRFPTPHRAFLAGFISKGARSGAAVDFHQDLSYTDERDHRATIMWVPLIDVEPSGGALAVVPGSHAWSNGLRAGGRAELPTASFQRQFAERAVVEPLRAGEAIVYDAALVHGSAPNATDAPRPALAVAFAPVEADLLRFHHVDGELRGYSVDTAHFQSHSLLSPPGIDANLEPWTSEVTAEDLYAHLQPAPPHDSVVNPPLPRSPQVLRDENADRRLRRDGFALVDLVDPSVAAELRAEYFRLSGKSEGSGFEADLNNGDLEYRNAVSDLLSARLDEACSAMFLDYRPFLRVFLSKWPGDGSDLYLHRDWMYVDERAGHRTFVVWVPLQDVTRENGALQVLRGTHRLDQSLRGTNLNAGWLNHDEAIRDRLLEVPIRAGQALIMDNCLVHCSLPNHSGETRLAAAVGWRPAEAGLVHFRRTGEREAVRYDIDDNFFFEHTPVGLMERAPDLPVAEVVPYEEQPYNPDQIARFVDGSVMGQLDRLYKARADWMDRRRAPEKAG